MELLGNRATGTSPEGIATGLGFANHLPIGEVTTLAGQGCGQRGLTHRFARRCSAFVGP